MKYSIRKCIILNWEVLTGEKRRTYYAFYKRYGGAIANGYNTPTVHIFATKKERDKWVKEDTDINPNPNCEAVSAKKAAEFKYCSRTYHINGKEEHYGYYNEEWIKLED